MSWTNQVEAVLNKLAKLVGILSRLRFFSPAEHKAATLQISLLIEAQLLLPGVGNHNENKHNKITQDTEESSAHNRKCSL